MAKKRTSLDSLFGSAEENSAPQPDKKQEKAAKSSDKITEDTEKPPTAKGIKISTATAGKSETVKQTVYLPPAVHEQLRQLAFEERKKMHDYLVEGLDRVFKNRGLKPYTELSGGSSDR